MEVKKGKKYIIAILVLLFASIITQCASNPRIVREADDTILKRRVQEYWDSRIKGEWDKSYLFELPEYREKVSIVKYIGQNARSVVKWEGFNIKEFWTSGDEGYVRLDLKYRYTIPKMQQKGSFERVVEEKWIKQANQWYHHSTGQ